MPLGVGGAQGLGQRLRLVVDHRVEAGDVAQPGGLLVRAGRADHVAALDLGDLGGDRAHRAGGGGDEHLLAVLQRARFQQAAIGGDPGAAERVHIDAERQVGVGAQHAHARAVAEEAVAEAAAVADDVAVLELGVAALNHAADAAAEHGGVQRLVGVEPGPHVGVDREQQVVDQHLALAGIGELGLHQGEILGHRYAVRSADEVDLTGGGHGGSPWAAFSLAAA